LAGAAGSAIASRLPQPEPVSIYLNVERGDGLITGLTHANFHLYEDGEARPFRLEQPEKPASIALLVEYSQASWYYLNDINATMGAFLGQASPGNWYALATYSHGLEIPVDFTTQTGRITEAYSQLGQPMWNEVDTYDAVYNMLDKMGRLPGRRILIVIGSGFDSFNAHTLEDVQKKAESENVVIFVAGVGSMLRGIYEPYLSSTARLSLIQARAFLQMLASKTGGFARFPNQEGAFPDVMRGIMQSINTQYRLVYETSAPGSGKFHKLKVEAFRVVNDHREDFKVLVRNGWR
jgi:VWFA-related protein